jgi:hypothetical protein
MQVQADLTLRLQSFGPLGSDLSYRALGFRRRTLRALAGACRQLRHLELADSIGVDFHKTGFAP